MKTINIMITDIMDTTNDDFLVLPYVALPWHPQEYFQRGGIFRGVVNLKLMAHMD